MINQVKDEMEQVVRNCKFYLEKGYKIHFVNEAGALRGMMYLADIIGIQYPKDEYYKMYILPAKNMMDNGT